MNKKNKSEKLKPFTMVKYFSYASLVVMLFGTAIISVLNIHWAKNMHLEKSRDNALVLVENLNHQVFLQVIVPIFMQKKEIRLREKKQFDLLDRVVKNVLHSFKVENVTLYSLNKVVLYSFNSDEIGKPGSPGPNFEKALANEVNYELVQTGGFFHKFGGVADQNRLLTFAPFRAEKLFKSGPTLGVFKVEQDLSGDYRQIANFQRLVLLTIGGVMVALFLVLLFIVKSGEGIIQKRAEERLRLLGELDHAKRLSAIGEMVAGISHEIRNPLGIIRSSAELLQKKMEKFDPDSKLPHVIVEESGRLNAIITDFLNFAKPVNPDLASVSVEEIVDKTLSYLAPQIDSNNYVIEKRVSQNMPKIMADANMIYQVFLNIIMNSMQAMPDGGAIIIKVVQADGEVEITFADHGPGIPLETLDTIWDPFFTTKETGTGLGLGIVKNIVESHQGSISFENRPEGGAAFTILLAV